MERSIFLGKNLSIAVKKNGEKTLIRSIHIKILAFWGLIVLSAVLLRPVQIAINEGMLKIRTEFIGKLEELTGLEIRYASMRPAFFGSFDIRNLRFMKGETSFFTVSRVKIYFSIPELLFQKKTFIHTVQIDKPMIRIDTAKDSDTLEFLSSLQQNNESGKKEALKQLTAFLPKNADYQIRNCYVHLIDGEAIYRIENMNLNLRENNGSILLNGKFGAEYRNNGFFNKTIIVRTGVEINGEYAEKSENGKAEIVFSNLSGSELDKARRQTSFFSPLVNNLNPRSIFTVNTVKTSLSYADGIIRLYQPQNNSSIDYDFRYDMEKASADAQININNFMLGEKIVFSDRFKKANHLLAMQITGDSSFTYQNNGEMIYSVNLKGGNTAHLSDGLFIDLHGNEKSISVNNFRLSASADTVKAGLFKGSFGFSGKASFYPFLPAGVVSFDSFSLSGDEDINAVFNVSSGEKEINISSERIEIARTLINTFDISIYPSDKDIGITVSGFFEGDSAVYLDAVYNKDPRQLEASLDLVSLSMFDITEICHPFVKLINTHPARGYLKKALINGNVFLSTDFKNIIYNAPNITYTANDSKVMFSLAGTDQQINLSNGIVIIDENEFLVSANMYFSSPTDLVFSFNAGFQDMSWNIDGQILDRTTLIIRDPNGLHAYGNISNMGAISGYIEGTDYPILINSNTAHLNFYSTLRYNSPDFWNFDVNRFIVNDLNSDETGYLKLTGAADQNGASFKNILYGDSVGELEGSVDFSWDSDFSYLEFTADIANGFEESESYFIEGSLRDEQININASVTEMRADRFIGGKGTTVVSAEASVSWESIEAFNARLDITSFESRLKGDTVQAAGSVILSNEEFLVSDFNLNYAGIETVLPVLRINCIEGIIEADGNIQGYTKGKQVDGKIDLNANFNQADSWLDINQAFDTFFGTLVFEDVQFGNETHDRFAFIFSGNEGAISLSGGIRDMIRVEMDADGNFFAGLSAPMPIRGSIIGTFKNGRIDSHVNNFFIDMHSLWTLAGQENDFNVVGGFIKGEIDIRGPVWNPEFYGSGMGSSFRFQVPGYISKDIRPIPFYILAEGYEMSFGPVDLVSGSGGGTIEGWFLFENWAPVNIGLEISIPKESPVPYDFNISGFLANGNASGDLNLFIDTNNSMLELKGVLFTNDAEMGLNMDEVEPASNVEFHSVVEVTVTTGSAAEFLWPNTGSPILKANPENGTVFHIYSDTQAGQFSLNGNVNIRSGELYYFDRNFYIRQGSIVFNENERQFDPRISARAEIRDRAESGMVTVSMIIENQPLFSFEPRFEANPSLTQLEIYSILGQNLNNYQGYDNTDTAQRFLVASTTDLLTQFVANSDVFGQFMFVRQFERQIRDFLHLDMFSVRTRFLQNAVVSGVVSSSEMGNSVGNYFDNTTVFIGKYIGQDMFVQGMLRLKYDENSSILGGLVIEPDIGIEWKSPFVNIRWDFFPSHPENFWVNDNSITLSWSKSF